MGPLLFTVYTRKPFQIVERHLPKVHCYADNTQLYVSFSPNRSAVADFAIKSLTDCISDIRSWMISDNLMLNDVKTKFLIIGTRQQPANVNINCIRVGSTDVCPVAKNLGSWFDEQLTMPTASYVVLPFIICIISSAFANICLENQLKCLSMHLLHLVLIIATVFCMSFSTTSLTNCTEF